MIIKKVKKSLIFKLNFKLGIFILPIFLFSFVFFVSKVSAIDGIMNGKTVTGQTDNYLFWLQTFDKDNYPFYFDQFFVNKSGSVGIGNAAPAYKLDVSGTGRFTQPVLVGTPTAINHAATKSYVDSAASSAAGGGVGAGTTGQTLRHNGTSWVANSNLYNNGTNVGIGTSNPRAKLDVYNTSIFDVTDIASGQDSLLLYGGSITPGYYGGISWLGGSRRRAGISAVLENSDSDFLGLAFFTQGIDGPGPMAESLRISHSGSVGIGTTAPAYKLDVTGTGRFTQPVLVGTPTAAGHATTKSYVDSTAVSAAGGGVGAGTTGQTLRHNGTSWVANSVLFNNGTNVGIGTTNPGEKLSLEGSALAFSLRGDSSTWKGRITSGTGSLSLGANYQPYSPATQDDVTKASWQMTLSPVLDKFYISRAPAGSTTLSELLTVLNSGNVGIGTTAPAYKLDVTGTGRFTQPVLVGAPTAAGHATTKSYVDSTASSAAGGGVGAGTTGQTLRHNGTSWVANSVLFNNGTNVGIGTTNPIYKLHILTATSSPSVGSFVLNNLRFGNETSYTWIQSHSSQPFVINPIGNNVGIGTTAPAYKLDVTGTGRFTQPVIVGAPTATNHATTKSYVDSTAVSAAGGGVGAGTTGQTLRHNGTSWVANSNLYNNGTNVGIGTTAPLSKLHVENPIIFTTTTDIFEGIRIAHKTSADGAFPNNAGSRLSFDFLWGGATRQTVGAIEGHHTAGWGGGLVFLTTPGGSATNTPTSRMVINPAGNVGIGTTAPAYKLDVTGTGRFTQPVIVGAPTAAGHATTKSYVDSTIGGGSGSTVGYWTMNGTNISNSNTGNVGIGTTSPTQKLDVAGNIMLNRNNLSWSMEQYDFSSSTVRANINPFSIKIWDNYNGASAPTTYGTLFDIYGRPGHEQSQLYFGSDGNIRYRDAFYSDTSFSPWSTLLMSTTDVNSSGNLRITGAGAHYISAGSVGIGTTAPAYKLDVSGTGRFTQPVLVGTPTAAGHATTKSYVDSTAVAAAGGGVGAGSSGQTLRHNGTSWVASSLLYNNGTNIGINTTNPTSKLYVNGSAALGTGNYYGRVYSWNPGSYYLDAPNAIISNVNSATTTATSYPQLIIHNHEGTINNFAGIGFSARESNSGGNQVMGAAIMTQFVNKVSGGWVSGDLHFMTKNLGTMNDAMVISYNGLVGIGTTAPAYKLDVTGTGRFTQPVIVGAPTATNHATTKSYVDSAAGGGVGAGTSGQTLRHNGTSWVANSVLFNNGTNVGIGTTGPTGKLTIRATSTDRVIIGGDTGDTNANSPKLSFFGGSGGSITGPSIQKINEISYGRGGLAFFTHSGADYTSEAEVMRIRYDGNVGIGTTAPAYKLDVTGTGRFTQPVLVGAPTAAGHATTKSYVDAAISNDGYYHSGSNFANGTLVSTNIPASAANGDSFVIEISGKSYSTTNAPFKVIAQGYLYNSTIISGSGISYGGDFAPYIKMFEDGGYLKFWWPRISYWNSFNVHVRSAGGSPTNRVTSITDAVEPTGTKKVQVDLQQTWNSTNANLSTINWNANNFYAAGSVGIGTAAPTYKLDVSGTGRFTQPVLIGTPTAAGHAVTKSYVDSAAGGGVGAGSSGQTLRHNGTSWVANSALYNNGTNIGIGTATPGAYKLNVAGSAYIGGALELSAGSNLVTSGTISANKINVGTIDPLYNLQGTNYASFAASVVGGVKEETTGRVMIDQAVADEYQKTIDFKRQAVGSDLWVWYNVIDFDKDNVEVLLTPYGKPANVYYSISGEKLTFHSDISVEVSYRLIAKRFDWRDWPTKAKDQNEKPNFILK
jgi:hypothetical protein